MSCFLTAGLIIREEVHLGCHLYKNHYCVILDWISIHILISPAHASKSTKKPENIRIYGERSGVEDEYWNIMFLRSYKDKIEGFKLKENTLWKEAQRKHEDEERV